jgi:hypothetical protein
VKRTALLRCLYGGKLWLSADLRKPYVLQNGALSAEEANMRFIIAGIANCSNQHPIVRRLAHSLLPVDCRRFSEMPQMT